MKFLLLFKNINLFVRSLVFNILFYSNFALFLVLSLSILFMPSFRAFHSVPQLWVLTSNWLLRVIAKIDFKVEGLEDRPDGPVLVAMNHQSFWETFVFVKYFRFPAFIYKHRLSYIPFFGWYLKKVRMIPIERENGYKTLRYMVREVKSRIQDERDIIIFPQGTRELPSQFNELRRGISLIYQETGLSCLPVVHNSGMFWPKSSFLRYPGTVTVKALPLIRPGLGSKEFMDKLSSCLHEESSNLIRKEFAKRPVDDLLPPEVATWIDNNDNSADSESN